MPSPKSPNWPSPPNHRANAAPKASARATPSSPPPPPGTRTSSPALAARIGDLPYAVAVGALAGANGIDEDAACAGLLQAFAANLISAAVRLVPLGQSTGLAVLAALEPDITAITAETRSATLDDLGGACFRSDIAAMRHETQYTRLFRS